MSFVAVSLPVGVGSVFASEEHPSELQPSPSVLQVWQEASEFLGDPDGAQGLGLAAVCVGGEAGCWRR